MKLNSLNVSQSEVRDLGPLRGMPLNYLSCRQTKVKDLGPLAGMPLRSIDVDLPDGAAGVLKILPAIEVVNGQRMRK
jgi:hypothetical protein